MVTRFGDLRTDGRADRGGDDYRLASLAKTLRNPYNYKKYRLTTNIMQPPFKDF